MGRRRSAYNSFVTPIRRVADPVVRVRSALSLLEDRRFFRPEGVLARPRAFFSPPRIVVRNANRRQVTGLSVPSALGFDVPHRVAICVRRKQRREVIHAKRLTKRGAGGAKHRNWWSEIRC